MVLQFASKSPRPLGGLAVALAAACFAMGADVSKKPFDLPADLAARSIKTFAQQAGVEVLIRAELGRKIRTQPVKGEFTPREALDRMLIHTGLSVQEDRQTGAMAIMSAPAANSPKDSPDLTSDSQAPAKKKVKPKP